MQVKIAKSDRYGIPAITIDIKDLAEYQRKIMPERKDSEIETDKRLLQAGWICGLNGVEFTPVDVSYTGGKKVKMAETTEEPSETVVEETEVKPTKKKSATKKTDIPTTKAKTKSAKDKNTTKAKTPTKKTTKTKKK